MQGYSAIPFFSGQLDLRDLPLVQGKRDALRPFRVAQRDRALGVQHTKNVVRLLNAIGYCAVGGPKPPEPLKES